MLENDWEHFDELVQALAARASDSLGLDSVRLRTKLLKLFADAVGRSLTFDFLTSLSDSEVSPKEQLSRKVAWTMQHALSAKAWCVNPKILSIRSGSLYSPIIEQLRRVGLKVGADRLSTFRQQLGVLGHKLHGTLDAVLLSHDYKTIYVVKGCSAKSLGRARSQYMVEQSHEGTLWKQSNRLIENGHVDTAGCRSLVLAWGILKDAFNDLNVVPIYCVVDDFDAGWHFQAHDFGEPYWAQFKGKKISLDAFSVTCSSLDEHQNLRDNPDRFNELPEWIADSAIYNIPPDRPARCLMILDVLFQQQSGSLREIVPIKEGIIADDVGRIYDIFYTKDMRRHDLLHLSRRGLVHKHPENRFSITPLGIARFHLASAAGRDHENDQVAQTIFDRVFRQAELFWKYRNV